MKVALIIVVCLLLLGLGFIALLGYHLPVDGARQRRRSRR